MGQARHQDKKMIRKKKKEENTEDRNESHDANEDK